MVVEKIQSSEDPIHGPSPVAPFARTLSEHGMELKRDHTDTLQINVGLLCNQRCRHCHLDAGPHRHEVMAPDTMDEIIAYAQRVPFKVIDITGGATEMNPHLPYLIEKIAPHTPRLMLRTNLTALLDKNADEFIQLCKAHQVVLIASVPSTNVSQTDAQRGKGVMTKSIEMLRRLNGAGYGREGTGLELNLISNPSGAFLPANQAQAEVKFKRDLDRKYAITFNNLFTFANVPLGRFRTWLEASGNLNQYLQRLVSAFNPCTVSQVMCRSLVSISWDGYLYDCDFNLAKGLPMAGRRIHVSRMATAPEPGTPIATGDHCYACTAGAGFT